MSSDDSSNAPSERRDAVREKAQQVKARQTRWRYVRTASIAVSVVAVVAVAAVVVTWTVSSSASKPLLNPAGASDDGFAVTDVSGVGADIATVEQSPVPAPNAATPAPAASAEATPTPTERPVVDIRVYVDYLSAGSRDFQVANAPQLSKWVSEGAATLTYYPVAMLTAKSNGTKYSLRAASAAACVATHAPDSFYAFNHALLTQQPELDSDGYSDDELATIAQAVGVASPKVVRACIEEEAFAGWARNATGRALKGLPDTEGVALTGPMVLVNGTQYVGALHDPKEFAQFVLTVESDAYYEDATPTPTATPSASPSPAP